MKTVILKAVTFCHVLYVSIVMFSGREIRTYLKHANLFNYLDTFVTAHGRCIKEVKFKRVLGKVAFNKRKNIGCKMSFYIEMRKRIYRNFIESILLHRRES